MVISVRATGPSDKPQKLFDSEELHLFNSPNGGKLWRLKYRHLGKEKLLSLGAYPTVGLKEAREKRAEAKSALAKGEDPSVEKRKAAALKRVPSAL